MKVRSKNSLLAVAVSMAMASVYGAEARAQTTAAFVLFDFKNYSTGFTFSGGSPPSTVLPTNAAAGDSRFGSSTGLGTAFSTYLTTDYSQLNVPTGTTGPTPGAVDATPARSTSGGGTVRTLGMSTNFGWGASNPLSVTAVSSPDINSTILNIAPGTPSVPTFRARGNSPANGWSQQAPQYTQGVEFTVPKTGWTDLSVGVNWFKTDNGIRNLQVLYSTDDGTTFQKLQGSYSSGGSNTFRASWSSTTTGVTNFPYGYFTASDLSATFQPAITLDFKGLANVDSASTLKVRLVSAYARANDAVDNATSWLKVLGPGGTPAQQTGGLDLGTAAAPVGAATNAYNFTPIGQPLYLGGSTVDPVYGTGGYNNSSGNWRFTNFVVTGTTTNTVSGGVFNPNALNFTWAPQGGSTVLSTGVANFTRQGSPGFFPYTTNNNLVFAGAGLGTVVATGGYVVANSIQVSNAAGTYVFSSQPGFGLSGFATLTKTGGGTLQLRPRPAVGADDGTGTNLFGGGVIVSAGTVRYWADSALGGGPLTVRAGGTTQVSSPLAAGVQYTTGVGANRDLIIGSALPISPTNLNASAATGASTIANFNIDTNVTATFGGAVQATDPTWYNKMVKTGGGTLHLETPTFFAPSGIQLGVTGGELRIGLPSGNINVWVAPEWATATAGNVVITGNAKLRFVRTDRADGNFNGDDVFSPGTVGSSGSTTGTITFTGLGIPTQRVVPGIVADQASASNTGGNTAIYAFGGMEIALNMPVRLAALDGTNAVTGRFSFGATARNNTTWNTLNINKTIFGNGHVYFATGTEHETGYPYQISGGNGLVNVNTTLTHTGDTYIAMNNAGVVRLNLNNAFPTGTRLAFGDDLLAPSLDVSPLDLNGYTLTVGSIDLGPRPRDPLYPRGTYGGIVNSSETEANLVLSGSVSSTYTGQVGKLATNGANTTYNFIINNQNTSINILTTPTFSGTQTFNGSLAMTGTVQASSGRISLKSTWNAKENDAGKASTVSATGSGIVSLNPNNETSTYSVGVNVASISITGNGRVLTASTNRLVNLPTILLTDSLVVGPTAFLDLSNNDLIVHQGDEASIRSSVAAWYNGGTPTTVGIGSSAVTLASGTVAASGTTLAVLANFDVGEGLGYFTSYDGQPLAIGDVLVKYTYLGDTNFDGIVDGADLSNLVEGLSTGLTGWLNGDLDYSGTINALDVNLYFAGLAAYQANGSLGNGQGALPTGGGAVPEPSGLAVVLAAATTLTRRRRVAR